MPTESAFNSAALYGNGGPAIAPPNFAAIPGAISTGIQAAQGAVVPAAMGIAAMTWANRNNRKYLRSDENQLASGQLGISNAQRNAMIGNTMAQQQALQASQNAQLQQALASGNLRGGAVTDIAAQQANATASAVGAANQNIDALSTQQAQQREAVIRQRLQDKAASNMQQAQYIAEALQKAPPQWGGGGTDLKSIQDNLRTQAITAGG